MNAEQQQKTVLNAYDDAIARYGEATAMLNRAKKMWEEAGAVFRRSYLLGMVLGFLTGALIGFGLSLAAVLP